MSVPRIFVQVFTPEAFYDTQVDVFSYGGVLYEVCGSGLRVWVVGVGAGGVRVWVGGRDGQRFAEQLSISWGWGFDIPQPPPPGPPPPPPPQPPLSDWANYSPGLWPIKKIF